MSDFISEREKAFEAKYKHDQDLKFQAQSRSNKQFGQWLGEKLGLSAAAQEAYGQELVAARLNTLVREELIKKIMKDIASHKADISEPEVRKALDRFYAIAQEEVAKERVEKKK